MKKTFWSLAALMLMAAPVMTSCSNDVDEVAPAEEVKENVVTLTIKMPEQAETRVGINNETLKLTGWEANDIVKVYKVGFSGGITIDGGIPFECTDPESGTFSGTLPDDKSLSDYNFAAYGHDIEVAGAYAGFFDNMISENLKDVVLLAGPISGGTCTMAIHNNVIKVTNNGSPVTVAWSDGSDFKELCYKVCDICPFIPVSSGSCGHAAETSNVGFAAADPITIPAGTSYIFMPATGLSVGLYTEGGVAVVPAKSHDIAIGKLYNAGTIGATGGSVEFAKSNTNISWSGTNTSTLTGTDAVSGITISFYRPDGTITRNATMGTISFAGAIANETITISVTGGTCTSVTNSLTSKTLEGAGPWTLTFKESPSVGWYTSGGEAFINAINLANTAKLTVEYE